MANKKLKKSGEALDLANEISKWTTDAAGRAKQPWMDDIVKTFEYAQKKDYFNAVTCLYNASKRKSSASEYLSEAAKSAIKLTKAKADWEKSKQNKWKFHVSEISDHLDELYINVYKELYKYQNALFEEEFKKTRVASVNEQLGKEKELQSVYEYELKDVNAIALYQEIPRDVLNIIYPRLNFSGMKYVEVTESVLISLNNNKKLAEEIRIDITKVGGFVTHSSKAIKMIEDVIRRSDADPYIKLQNPLIVLKKNYTLSTLYHELTHACIKDIDYFIHHCNMWNKYPYDKNPEEILAFLNQILLYQYLSPGDTFDEYIRIQARMNIQGSEIVKTGEPHIGLQKSLWMFLKDQAKVVKKSNIASLQKKAVSNFISPVLKIPKYRLLSTKNKQANEKLIDAHTLYGSMDFDGAASKYKEVLAAVPKLEIQIKKHIEDLELVFADQTIREASLLFGEGESEEATKLCQDAISAVSGKARDRISDFLGKNKQEKETEIKKSDRQEKKEPSKLFKFLVSQSESLSDLLRPGWNNKYGGHERCVKYMNGVNNQNKLAKIAVESKEKDYRKIAIQKLEGEKWQQLLSDIVINDSDSQCRQIAIEKLDEDKWQELIASIAMNDFSSFCRKAAIDKLDPNENQNVLLTILIKDKYEPVNWEAIKKLSDQKMLAEVAKRGKLKDIRKEAVKKLDIDNWQELFADIAKHIIDISDVQPGGIGDILLDKLYKQELIADVAAKANRCHIQNAAIEKLDADRWQYLFADIAKLEHESDDETRKVIFNKLYDQDLLLDIAKNAKDNDIRRLAIRKLNVKNLESLLIDIAESDQYGILNTDGMFVVNKLKDQKLLANVARNSIDSDVQIAAIEKLDAEKWQALFAEIARGDNAYHSDEIREFTVKKLCDQKLLADVAKNAGQYDTRISAIEQLDRDKWQALFAEIAKDVHGNSKKVGKKAIEKLNDQELLTDVAKTARSNEMRRIAITKLDPSGLQSTLAEIVSNDNDNTIVELAMGKLHQQEVIADIAKNSENIETRYRAFVNIDISKRPDLMAEVVKGNDKELYSDFILAVQYIDDIKYIADIAKNASHPKVRSEAIECLEIKSSKEDKETQKVLSDIVDKDPSKAIRKAALDLLYDQDYIAHAAKSNGEIDVRKAAIDKLDGEKWQALLAEIVSNENDKGLVLKVISKLEDSKWQELLEDIVRNEEEETLRKAAIRKLDGVGAKQLLADIAIRDDGWPALWGKSRAAFKELSDLNTLGHEAVIQLSDQETLSVVATRAQHQMIRAIAIKKLDSGNWTNLLEGIALSGDVNGETAVDQLTDQHVLANIAKKSTCDYSRAAAIKKLDSEKWSQTLIEFIITDSNEKVVKAAFNKLSDPKEMAFIVSNASDEKTRKMALDKLTGEQWYDLFIDIVKNESSRLLRRTAARKLPIEAVKGKLDEETLKHHQNYLELKPKKRFRF